MVSPGPAFLLGSTAFDCDHTVQLHCRKGLQNDQLGRQVTIVRHTGHTRRRPMVRLFMGLLFKPSLDAVGKVIGTLTAWLCLKIVGRDCGAAFDIHGRPLRMAGIDGCRHDFIDWRVRFESLHQTLSAISFCIPRLRDHTKCFRTSTPHGNHS